MRSTVSRTFLFLGLGAALILPTGCRTAVNTTAAATTGATASGPTNGTAAGTGTGGPGSVTLAVTQPVAVSGHAGASVTCETGRGYSATAQSATIDGYRVSFTVRIAAYRGPGDYPALVTLRLDGDTGAVSTISAVPGIPATITSDGGSFAVNVTGDDGRTLAASLRWICG